MNEKADLGDLVLCKVTGFKGTVIGKSTHLYGCDRAGVQPVVDKEGKIPEAQWFDIDNLKVLKRKVVVGHTGQSEKRGGPSLKGQTPPRFSR